MVNVAKKLHQKNATKAIKSITNVIRAQYGICSQWNFMSWLVIDYEKGMFRNFNLCKKCITKICCIIMTTKFVSEAFIQQD